MNAERTKHLREWFNYVTRLVAGIYKMDPRELCFSVQGRRARDLRKALKLRKREKFWRTR